MEYQRDGLKSDKINALIAQVDRLGGSSVGGAGGVKAELIKSLIRQGNMPINILDTFASNMALTASKRDSDFSAAQFVESVAEVCNLVGEGITCEIGRGVGKFTSR